MIRFLSIACAICIVTITSCSKNTKRLSRSDFGDDWPFKVENGVVECLDGHVVVFISGGESYALNDAARFSGDYKNLREIIRPDANYPGRKIKMDLSQIEFEGLKLCDR